MVRYMSTWSSRWIRNELWNGVIWATNFERLDIFELIFAHEKCDQQNELMKLKGVQMTLIWHLCLGCDASPLFGICD